MDIKMKSQLLLFTVAVISSILSAHSGFSSSSALIESAQKRELKEAAALIQTSIGDQIDEAASYASLVASLPDVKRDFRARNREDLVVRLGPAMRAQREQFGVDEANFILPPARSFLELYDLREDAGEDLSKTRLMALAANIKNEPQRGFEIGHDGLSIRAIYPVNDDYGLVGSFETGMSFDHVIKDVKKTTGFELGIFVDDKLMSEIATHASRPDSERILGGFRAVEVSDWGALKPLLSPALFARARDVSVEVVTMDGIDYGIVLVPVFDYEGRDIGTVVAMRSFEEFHTQKKWALVKAAAMACLQMLLLVGALLLVTNAMLLRPFGAVARACGQLAQGSQADDLAGLAERNDEIGSMAKSLLTLAPRPDGGERKSE